MKLDNPLKYDSIQGFIAAILDIVVNIGAVIAVFFFVYSGFLFVSARGDTEKLKTARATFFGTVIGTAILLGAKLIAEVIRGTIKEIGGPFGPGF
ncbi:MAG: hypothetical protein HYT43_02190 [Candidatus Taylorbacteria bacterium]|nr:hypothetical protein [Candidatus Taylorbacteria bacterium]